MQKSLGWNTIIDILPGFYPSVYTTVVVGFLSVQTGKLANRGTLENSRYSIIDWETSFVL